jgi:HPt (histidine-containing phosphotransfer) domain-containing protein
VGRQPYDVVLMDMQMPEMDGLEATRQIRRKWPGGEGPHIIAMTANVMPGDRERCFEAGMDDFVPKPIRVEALVEALRKAPSARTKGVGAQRVPPHPRSLSPEGEGRAGVGGEGLISGAEATETQILDPGALEILLGVIGGDETMLRELIDSVLHDAPPLLADLRRALAQDDAAGIRRAAHTLKSSGSEFGATVLAGLCQELEDMVREGRLTGAEGYVQHIEGEYAQVQEALASVEVRGGEIVIHHNLAHQEVALLSPAQGEPGPLPVEAATDEQAELPSPEAPARQEGPTQAAQAHGPGRAPLLPRGIRTLADLIGQQPHLLEELLDDLLAENPERADALEQWIAELHAWQRSRPRLRKT